MSIHKPCSVYILSTSRGNVLYTGVTSDLKKRIWEHKTVPSKAFTWKYNVNKLVYFEEWDNILEAIGREKQIKGGSRRQKVLLISKLNPAWVDLYRSI